MTLQKLSMLNKHLPFAPKPMDGVLSAPLGQKRV